MKKHFKSVISLLLALVMLAVAVPFSDISASAASKLSKKIEYDYYGTAFVTLTPGDSDNYITYTTDGTAPKKNSAKYDGEIAVYEKTTLRVAEYTTEGKKVKGIKFTVTPKIAPVTFKVTQLGGKAQVTLSCATEGAEIRYTTDGSKPTQSSALYTDKIVLTEKTKIRAKAYCDGYKTTTTYAKTVKITSVADEDVSQTEDTDDEKETSTAVSTSSEKVVDDQKISYKITYMDNGTTYVTLTPAKNGYTIRYTTDGSVPSKSSKKYKSRIGFEEPSVLRARQYNAKGECVGTIKLNVKIKCSEIEFTCISMDTGIREIAMTCDTPGATIYYTVNGQSPKDDGARVYTDPIVVSEYADIKAYASKDGYKDGPVAWEIAGNIKMKLEDFDFSDAQYQLGLDALNVYRTANACSKLELDENLTKAASLRAYELSVNYDHTRPSGKNYTSVVSEYGVQCMVAAEFIDKYHDSASEFIKSVMSDKDDADRVLGRSYDFTKVGIGYYEFNGVTYWVLLMAG